MQGFKQFLTESSDKDVQNSIKKLPKAHQALLKGFRVTFDGNHTLPGDDEHIGKVDGKTKKITVAAPFFHSRQFAFLHEIAHLVWAKWIGGTPLEEKWKKIVAKTKNKGKENAEELFCHNYAQFYCDNKLKKFDHGKDWEKFIENLPK